MESRLRGLKFNENDKVSQFMEINCSYAKRFLHVAINNYKKNDSLFFIRLFFSMFPQSNDSKDKENSPFDTNGLKKDESVSTNGGLNGIDDDKGFK